MLRVVLGNLVVVQRIELAGSEECESRAILDRFCLLDALFELHESDHIRMTTTDRIVLDLLASQPDRPPCVEVVEPMMAQVLRSKTPAERLAIAWGLWRFARDTLRRSTAAQHPDWSEDEINREAVRRLVPDA